MNWRLLVKDVVPFCIALALQPFIHSELAYTLVIVGLIIGTFLLRYERNEGWLFVLGTFIGLVFELGGGLIYRLQTWENASLYGIPFWLPLLWGYGFVMIRRIGNYVVSLEK